MCISPIRIRNPNYHSRSRTAKYKDTSSLYINVPCGYCPDCISVKQMGFTQRVQMESLDNHIFFCTLTYNSDSLRKVVCSDGFEIAYADITDVQRMMKRLRKSNVFGRSFRYCAVSERGSIRGRPHFHLLFFVEKKFDDDFGCILNLERLLWRSVLDEWKRNYGSNRKPIWKPLCTYVEKSVRGRIRKNFDLHYVNPLSSENGEMDVAFYVSKYMCKSNPKEVRLQQALRLNLPPDEYSEVWKLVRSRSFFSVGFGYNGSESVKDYITKCVSDSFATSDFPCFFNKYTGQSFPLSRYYKSHGDLYSFDDHVKFWNKSHVKDNVSIDDSHVSEKLRKIEKFSSVKSSIEQNDYSFEFTNLV